jgi:hypothetical protein
MPADASATCALTGLPTLTWSTSKMVLLALDNVTTPVTTAGLAEPVILIKSLTEAKKGV